MTEYLERVYDRYSEVRPCLTAPRSSEELLARKPIFRKHFLPWLPRNPDANILDIGCGYGEFLFFLQDAGYRRTAGIDLDQRQLDVAQRLGVRNVRRVGATDALIGSPGEFDFISAIDVLEHIPKNQILELLDLVRAALRQGGRFVCQVPNLAAFYKPLFYMDFTHETPFTASSLKQVLQLGGFSDLRVLPMGPVVHNAKSAVRFVLWKAISSGFQFIQAVEGGPPDASNSIYTAAILAVADKS